MDDNSFREDETPARLIALQIYQDSFMKKKKWKHVAGALIASSLHGRARLEIFHTEEDLNASKPSKIILLDDCLSIRIVELQDDTNRHLKLTLRDGTNAILKADNVFALRTQLSRLAFPTQFVALNRPFSIDSPTTPDLIPIENSFPVPVLLLQSGHNLQEGSYGLLFGEERLELRKEEKTAALFDYENIHWIASGDYCFGFETNRTSQLYEFKCTKPQQIIDSYRLKCKFRAHFHPTCRPTVNHYLRFYYPDMLRSGESTLSSESKSSTAPSQTMLSLHAPPLRDLKNEETTPSSSSRTPSSLPMQSPYFMPSIPESSRIQSECDEILPHQIRNVRFAPVVTTEINPKAKNKIVGFFKNISPFNRTPTERSAFEQRANNEFRLAAAKKKGRNPEPKTAQIIRYDPDLRSPRVGSSEPTERPLTMPQSSPNVDRPTTSSNTEPVYSPIPLALASSPLDPSITTLVSHLAPASRVSLASGNPAADAARVSRVEILQSSYIE